VSDYIETLWKQFAIEVDEHLELIDPLLVQAESEVMAKEEVDQLFRSFHSIKGLSKAMDLLGMEAIAHHCEDLLGLVRDGGAVIDADSAPVLLDAVDALRSHIEVAQRERQDTAPSEDLLLRLKQTVQTLSGSQLSEPEPITGSVEQITTTSLHDDFEILIFFSELLSNNLPSLAEILNTQFSANSENYSDIINNLESLAFASQNMGFEHLYEQFLILQTTLSIEQFNQEENHEVLVATLAEVVSDVHLIEGDINTDCGIAAITQMLQRELSDKADRQFTCLVELLQQVSEFATDSDNTTSSNQFNCVEVVSQLADLIDEIHSYLGAMNVSSQARWLILTIYEVCKQDDPEKLCHDQVAIRLLQQALSEIQHYYRFHLDKTLTPPQVDVKDLSQQIWQAVNLGMVTESGQPLNSFSELTNKIALNPVFSSSMSLDKIRVLQNWIENDGYVYEILVSLEQSEVFTKGFLSWLEQNVQVITNHTEIKQGVPWTEFLLLSESDEQTLRKSVTNLDPDRQYLEIKLRSRLDTDELDTMAAETDTARKESSMLRVSGATLDQFMNSIGEMISIRGRLNHNAHATSVSTAINIIKQHLEYSSKEPSNVELPLKQLELLSTHLKQFDVIDQQLHTELRHLQESALFLRVVPMDTVFKRFPRFVRDLANKQGKKVKLEIIGKDVRIDKSMVEILLEPLMHMVRNSVDHGIEDTSTRQLSGKSEQAKVTLEARQKGNFVYVIIADDGCGIDVEVVKNKAIEKGLITKDAVSRLNKDEIMQFIFAPGFSTAVKVTETSGRGVGMDVVRTNVTQLGGSVDVNSVIGEGTTFNLKLPLSAAIQDTLLVKSSDHTLAIPERYITEMIDIKRSEIQWVKGYQAIVLRDKFLPIYQLGPLLGFNSMDDYSSDLVVIILSDGKQRMGVVVDRSYQRQELFVKDIHEQLITLPGVSGASILRDGAVVLILDIDDLFKLAVKRGENALLKLSQSKNVAMEVL
jgi:two-component system chemotaxis sensor kinase CheA